ncbi:MAG: glycosyltransferase [Solirubrobacterales bacterium]|nr:glycosyltransferase [Solirubrobacterales bacterium]
MISVCVATYKAHPAPNLRSLGTQLEAALSGEPGELCVALNGISAADAGVPAAARTVPLGVNRGVAPGWNAAASVATGDVLVFLNDDCELGPGALAQLAAVLRSEARSGVVGPGGARWSLVTGERESFVPPGEPGSLLPCDVVDGHCFAVRRATYDAVGGFDEFYAPASWEEVDFCTAVRASGLENLVVGGVPVAHEWGISAKAPPWRRIAHNGRKELLWSIHRRNRAHLIEKWSHLATAPD